MTKFESSVKHVAYSQEQVYNKLSDLNNLSSVKERLDQVKDQVDDKLKDIQFDQDSITLNVQGMNVTLKVVEREPMKCIKLTIGAELNIFIKKMAEKPLTEGAEKIAEMLSMIKY